MTFSPLPLDPSQITSAFVDSGKDKVMDDDYPARQTQEELKQIRETILKNESDFTTIQDCIWGMDSSKVHSAYISVIHRSQDIATQLMVDLTSLIKVLIPLFKNDDIGEAQKNKVIDRYIESFNASTHNMNKPGAEFLRIQGDVQIFHEQITKAISTDFPTPQNYQPIEDVRKDLINLQPVFDDLTAHLSVIGNIWPTLIVDAGSLHYNLQDLKGKSTHSAAVFEARVNSVREGIKYIQIQKESILFWNAYIMDISE
ncbi:hypothetical protein CPB84DRAFT_1751787 [Gymnopilus junonius]|uniref:Uncharacterized protein n=1 Tax=Gymnopilus junonius TaxID=109634 RepID=A0A9P5TGR1_GYMJU|nr:hypothetical protein CPB84DRAFT_1751787 [Gymnopilus junonius]